MEKNFHSCDGLPESPSEQDNEHPLITGERNTNTTFDHDQNGENCYALAACRAYLNVIMRIFGKYEPAFEQPLEKFDYNNRKGG